jgi:hypothetical protein
MAVSVSNAKLWSSRATTCGPKALRDLTAAPLRPLLGQRDRHAQATLSFVSAVRKIFGVGSTPADTAAQLEATMRMVAVTSAAWLRRLIAAMHAVGFVDYSLRASAAC